MRCGVVKIVMNAEEARMMKEKLEKGRSDRKRARKKEVQCPLILIVWESSFIP